jgi:hypothetical protein
MTIRQSLADNQAQPFPFPASTVINIGDLLWWDATNHRANAAANRADTGTLLGNQADFLAVFLGVAAEARLATETSVAHDALRLVVLDGVFDCDCTSAIWEVGDLVGIDRNAATPANYNQQVVKVADKAHAIGVCVQRSSNAATAEATQIAATKVRVRLTSALAYNLAAHA